MFRITLTATILFVTLTGTAFSGSVIELKTAAQDSQPKYIRLAGGEMGGICIDIMQAVERLDPDIRFNGYQDFLPFKRLQLYLETGELDVFFGLKNSAERLQKLIFSNSPLYQLNYVVAVRMDDDVSANSIDDIRSLGEQGNLSTVFGSAAGKFLKNQGGLHVNDSAPTPERMIKALLAGRSRFAFYHDLGLRQVIQNESLAKQIRILPTSFSTYHHYAAYSRNLPGEVRSRIDAALERLKNDGTLAGIHQNYGLIE